MALFDQVLLTVDFDRTFTDPNSVIPARNLEAVQYFTENGGAFTINTGRGVGVFWHYLDKLPVNAPYLLYNGAVIYENGKFLDCQTIDLDMWDTIRTVANLFPDMNLEIQGTKTHYLVNQRPEMIPFYDAQNWLHEEAVFDADIGPFIKFALFGRAKGTSVGEMFSATEEERARFDEAEQTLNQLFGDKVDICRAATRIIDVQAKGVSKGNAARKLLKMLNRQILVCVGDADNDLAMLNSADFAYCPADSILAGQYETVCPCAEGSVADVIYKKIPEILNIQP